MLENLAVPSNSVYVGLNKANLPCRAVPKMLLCKRGSSLWYGSEKNEVIHILIHSNSQRLNLFIIKWATLPVPSPQCIKGRPYSLGADCMENLSPVNRAEISTRPSDKILENTGLAITWRKFQPGSSYLGSKIPCNCTKKFHPGLKRWLTGVGWSKLAKQQRLSTNSCLGSLSWCLN